MPVIRLAIVRDGAPFTPKLVSASREESPLTLIPMPFDSKLKAFVAVLQPGAYRVKLDDEWLSSRPALFVQPADGALQLHLGKPKSVWVRSGTAHLPIDPHPDTFIAVVPYKSFSPSDVARLNQVLKDNKLDAQLSYDERRYMGLQILRGHLSSSTPYVELQSIQRFLQRAIECAKPPFDPEGVEEVAVGTEVIISKVLSSTLTDRYIVYLHKATDRSAFYSRFQSVYGICKRDLQFSDRSVLVLLNPPYRTDPYAVFKVALADLVEDYEPDILDVHTAQEPGTAPQPVPYLGLQEVPTAWNNLEATLNANSRYGRPSVHIVVIEAEPVDSSDQRVAGALTPTGSRFAYGIDLRWNQDMLTAAYAQRVLRDARDLTHGMGTYGIVASAFDASSAWGGIASNTTQMFIRVSLLRLADLSDMLVWLSSSTGRPPPACAFFPRPPAADVIYIAISSTSSLPRALRETADVVTPQAVLVYPAGNDTQTVAWLAEHPNVLSVGNTCYSQLNNSEVKCASSNFGPNLSLCAMGEGAKSLTYGANGTQLFGGTSAAAPMVAAAAALVKSVNAALSPTQIREILCLTVDKVDETRTSGEGQWMEPDGSGGWQPVSLPPPTPRSNTRSDWYGFGRLNVNGAVLEAIARLP